MADERVKTILELEADASPLQKLTGALEGVQGVFERAFGGGALANLERIDRELGKSADEVDRLTRAMQDMDRESSKLDRTSDAYRKLQGEIRGVYEAQRNASERTRDLQKEHQSALRDANQAQRQQDQQWSTAKQVAFQGLTQAFGGGVTLGGVGAGVSQLGTMAAAGIPGGAGMMLGLGLASMGLATQAAAQTVGAAEQYQAARRGAYPFAGGVAGDRGMYSGIHFGVDPTQAAGMAAQFYAQVGGRGFGGVEGFQAMLAAQQLGIDPGAAAQVFRAMRPGRGGVEGSQPGNMLASVERTAQALGLRGAEKGEFAGQMAGTVLELGQRGGTGIGLPLSLALQLGRGGIGLAGPQAGRVAGEMTRAGYATGEQGPQDAIDVALMRAAGWDGSGAQNYWATRKKMQQDPAGMWTSFLQSTFSRYNEGPREVQEGMIQQALRAKGVNVGAGGAESIARALRAPGGLTEGVLVGATDLVGDTSASNLIARGMRAAGRADPTGAVRSGAGLAVERIGVGTELIGVTRELERANIDAARAILILKPELLELAGMARGAAGSLKLLTSGIHGIAGGGYGAQLGDWFFDLTHSSGGPKVDRQGRVIKGQ